MAYLSELVGKLNSAYFDIWDVNYSSYYVEVSITSTLISDLTSTTAALIKLEIPYPENLPVWDDIIDENSTLGIFYKDPQTGTSEATFLAVSFNFLKQLGISTEPGGSFTLFLTATKMSFSY